MCFMFSLVYFLVLLKMGIWKEMEVQVFVPAADTLYKDTDDFFIWWRQI